MKLMKTLDIREVMAFFLIVFSGFFMTQVNIITPFYITFSLAIYLYFIFLQKINLTYLYINLIFIVSALYFILTQYLINGSITVLITVIYSIIYFPLVMNICINISNIKIRQYIVSFINVSTVLLVFEFIVRIIKSGGLILSFTGLEFYKYKFNSIMYNDTNFVGMFILTLIFFILYLNTYKNFDFKITSKILIILLIFTYCRASIIATILFYIFFKSYIKAKNKIRFLLVVFIVLCIVSLVFFRDNNDGSLKTKLEILHNIGFGVQSWSIRDWLIGIGFNNSPMYIGRASHNYILTFFFESGVLGLSSILSLHIIVALKTKGRSLIVFLPFLVAGMSFAPYAMPYLYSIYGIIFYLENFNYCVVTKL